MWTTIVAMTLVEMFDKQDTVSKTELRDALLKTGEAHSGKLLREAYDDAALIIGGVPLQVHVQGPPQDPADGIDVPSRDGVAVQCAD